MILADGEERAVTIEQDDEVKTHGYLHDLDLRNVVELRLISDDGTCLEQSSVFCVCHKGRVPSAREMASGNSHFLNEGVDCRLLDGGVS